MKVIVEQSIGGDGAKFGAYIEGDQLVAKVSYPLEKVVEPVSNVVDNLLMKLEAAIPGTWDKAIIDPIRADAKAQLVKLLSE